MDSLGLPDWMDQYRASQMVQLRGLGYSQSEIASIVGVSQGTVSRYLAAVNQTARQTDDAEKLLIGLVGVAAGAALATYLLSRR